MRDSVRLARGARALSIARQRLAFAGSADYWERRYRLGRTSGSGSYGDLARRKAEFLNTFVDKHDIGTVIEFGCGDGHQLSLAEYPAYIGLDVSRSAIQICKRTFAADSAKSFFLYDGACYVDHGGVFSADLAMSLDVIYHLVEDAVFEEHMRHLFGAGQTHVIIYATNATIPGSAPHVRHRRFTAWIEHNCPMWQLVQIADGPGSGPGRADFFVYERLCDRSH
ncbi:MAG: hypothetical protein ACRDRJ_02605 [Streptosporangiaceae bacterium]